MYHIQNLKRSSFLRWVFVDLTGNRFISSTKSIRPNGSYHDTQNPRFYTTKAACKTKNGQNLNDLLPDDGNGGLWSRVACREAQDALLDYLHSTRSLQFVDAENISRNSPKFLGKLLKGVKNKENVGQFVTRYLRYHPINEFEPFFESMGLEPYEFSTFLPRNLMFLSDDNVLLENYHVFCQYGFAPNKIGKIYKEAKDVFRYNHGVLSSRLHDLQNIILDQSTVIKLVGLCPSLLIPDAIHDVLKVVKELKSSGIMNGWFIENLSEENSYDWRHILELLCLFKRLGCENEQLGRLVNQHPTLLLNNSGTTSVLIIGFLTKFGATKTNILSFFMKFPEIKGEECLYNLRRSYHFLLDIEMEVDNIAKLFCTHPYLLGSWSLKGVKTALNSLNSGKKRLCGIIMKNPQELKNLAIGTKVKPLPSSKDCTEEKTKFLLDLGFVEDSNEMKRALKRFRGRAGELQERFDCLVNMGFDRKDVVEMLKSSPQIVNQTKEVLEMKIGFLVNEMGYELTCLCGYPSSLSYAIETVKLRCMMYNWLKEQGVTNTMALSTILACSEKQFIKDKVNRHPKGIQVYEMLKTQIYSDCVI
ncbi:transcription termination factor MTEF18, mitochondrial isoform X1 [Lactuca sativa]|uniref:Uncharacterized protein n=1 Tax=Lactuca sativa TaxID=4236 RepID=A0A9R1UDJ6_LACSA|nr:transcription termination factor MTEF18, mitochondrial isoform X1 [Lactuca sativa]KAJ0185156.1 hypothetical protein LSAT_V11C900465930 [Lactuca sativa]